jgi:hypothetical protein
MPRKRFTNEQIAFALRQAEGRRSPRGRRSPAGGRRHQRASGLPGQWLRPLVPALQEALRPADGAADAAEGAGRRMGRYGYRRLPILLRREGWEVNHMA